MKLFKRFKREKFMNTKTIRSEVVLPCCEDKVDDSINKNKFANLFGENNFVELLCVCGKTGGNYINLVNEDNTLRIVSFTYTGFSEHIFRYPDIPKGLHLPKEIVDYFTKILPNGYDADAHFLKENDNLLQFLDSLNRKKFNTEYLFSSTTIHVPTDEKIKTKFNSNANNLEEPVYFSNGIIFDDEIHLGTYWLNQKNYKQVALRKAKNCWYICFDAMWSACQYESRDIHVEIKLSKKYFKKYWIKNTNDFLTEFLNGYCKPCVELIKKDSDVLNSIESICDALFADVQKESLKEVNIVKLSNPSFNSDSEDGFSLINEENGFYLKHSTLKSRPENTCQYGEEITKLPDEIKTKSELFSYMTENYRHVFDRRSNEQTRLSDLFTSQVNVNEREIKVQLSRCLGLISSTHFGGYYDPRDEFKMLYENNNVYFIVHYEYYGGPALFKVLPVPNNLINIPDLTNNIDRKLLFEFERDNSDTYSSPNMDFWNRDMLDKISTHLSEKESFSRTGTYQEGVAYLAAWERMHGKSLLTAFKDKLAEKE